MTIINDKIIGLIGMAGSGKDTVAQYLQDSYGYTPISFADKLKDCVSVVFGWDREMLSGKTEESRIFRETEDVWWTKRLDRKITPRLVLQLVGTESFRNVISYDIWVATAEKYINQKFEENPNHQFVFSDVRFHNEMDSIRKTYGGFLVFIQRGELPEWYEDALIVREFYEKNSSKEQTDIPPEIAFKINRIEKIHPSEKSWVGYETDYMLENHEDINSLYKNVDSMIQYLNYMKGN